MRQAGGWNRPRQARTLRMPGDCQTGAGGHDKLGLPLSRFSRSELRRQVLEAGIVADTSRVTIWRWLHEDALRPLSRRSWIFPRDPDFATKAGRVLDLYSRRWDGR